MSIESMKTNNVIDKNALINNVFLPIRLNMNTNYLSYEQKEKPGMLIAHGLGSKNPKSKNHLKDDWTNIIIENESIHNKLSYLACYTARGHGTSHGWEDTAELDLEQFTWKRLADDMLSLYEYIEFQFYNSELLHNPNINGNYNPPNNFNNINDHHHSLHIKKHGIILAGSSQGAATSIYACIKDPMNIKALILIRPPTAWEERKLRRKNLLSSANKCEQRNELGTKFHFVLRGAALSDLPNYSIDNINNNKSSSNISITNDYNDHMSTNEIISIHHSIVTSTSVNQFNDKQYNRNEYATIKCPVLILAVEGDSAHPVSIAVILKSLLPTSELYIASGYEEAKNTWPDIILTFLDSIR